MYHSMNNALKETSFRRFASGEIRAAGWLRRQLEIQANGLSGNLDSFWPDIKDSGWIGGSTPAWERFAYWLDGFIPLAWVLDDDELKQRARRYMDYIIENEAREGLAYIEVEGKHKGDIWAVLLMLKVITGYCDITGDERVAPVVRRVLRAVHAYLQKNEPVKWARSRWFEGLISIFWLYERSGEQWLLDLAQTLSEQGRDWISFFDEWPYKSTDYDGPYDHTSHVVNNAMMLRSGALLWRMTGDPRHLESAERMVALLDTYHGMITGVFSGDEHLAGNSPIQGTELCAVGEYMFSLETLISITGAAHWGDRLETIAFNALPATFSPDMWSHQYDQQVNQIECSRQEHPVYTTNHGDANTFGLEPNFGCCTANLSQPWPKLAASVFMRAPDGIAAVAYAPAELETVIDGVGIDVRIDTGYPFREKIDFEVTTEAAIDFAFQLRIPGWCIDAVIDIDGQRSTLTGGDFHRINRRWEGTARFSLELPMKPQVVARPNDLSAVTRGPLVYSLPIGERWVRINEDEPGKEFPHCDYEIYPTTHWGYALCVDPNNPENSIDFVNRDVGESPFSPDGAPVTAHLDAKKLDWESANGAAAPVPDLSRLAEEVERITLIPYGCTNLRMTEMPVIEYRR